MDQSRKCQIPRPIVNFQSRRDVPPPEDGTVRIVARHCTQPPIDPYLPRLLTCGNYESSHLVRLSPTTIIGIEKWNTRCRHGLRVACLCCDEVKHLLSHPRGTATVGASASGPLVGGSCVTKGGGSSPCDARTSTMLCSSSSVTSRASPDACASRKAVDKSSKRGLVLRR